MPSIIHPSWNYERLLDLITEARAKYGAKLREAIVSIDCQESILAADHIDIKDRVIEGVHIIMEPFLDAGAVQFVLAEDDPAVDPGEEETLLMASSADFPTENRGGILD